MSSEFTYYAFISYSHKDEAWAKWIQEAIERYRLPAIIRKEVKKPLPKKIQPVFLDQTDLGVGKLVDNLHQELEKSRFLIVVCSPNSAQPNSEGRHFIEEEVTHFCSLGREKQIIPVIVEGTPQTAFCPKLKKSDILAIDATKESKPKILNDLVATILGLRRDELWNRERRRQRQQRIRCTILGVVVGVLVAFIGLFAWDANRTVKNYYADYVDSFGLPEGIFKLKKSELKGRHIHYRFEYRGFQHGESPHADSADWCIWNLFGFRRRLVRVVQANSRGYPRELNYGLNSDHCMPRDWALAEYSERPMIQDFKYDSDLRLTEIKCSVGKYKVTMFYTHKDGINGLCKFYKKMDCREIDFLVSKIRSASRGVAYSNIGQFLLCRDGNGRVNQRLFLDIYGMKTANAEGIFGSVFENDKIGRPLREQYIAFDNNLMVSQTNDMGFSEVKYFYMNECLVREEKLNHRGDIILAHKNSFDKNGNLIKTESVDSLGKQKIIPNPRGRTEALYNFDQIGNITTIQYKNNEGRLIEWKDLEYDKYGRVVAICNHDIGSGSSSTLKYHYGRNVIKKISEHGGIIMEYNEHGISKEIELDGGGLVRTNGDYSITKWEYDDNGRVLRKLYYSYDNKPARMSYWGDAGEAYEYDKRGNLAKIIYLDVDHKILRNPQYEAFHSAVYVMKYDDSGRIVETKVYDGNDVQTGGRK